jgi:hypothetical protein
MLWKIYYDDESIITNEDMEWKDAPAYGILIILHYQPNGKYQIHMGSDYYLMRDNTVMSFPIKDLHDHLLLGIPKGAIKFGRWCPDKIWKKVHDKIFGKQ